jgi:hypothetical protein
MTHEWWPHLFSFPRFLDPISWLWLSVKGYAFTSSGEQISIPVGLGIVYWHHTCSNPRCFRWGKHPTADGLHKLCRRCHPDLPNKRRLSLAEITKRHRDAQS